MKWASTQSMLVRVAPGAQIRISGREKQSVQNTDGHYYVSVEGSTSDCMRFGVFKEKNRCWRIVTLVSGMASAQVFGTAKEAKDAAALLGETNMDWTGHEIPEIMAVPDYVNYLASLEEIMGGEYATPTAQ